MIKIDLTAEKNIFLDTDNILKFDDMKRYLFENKIGILLILDYIKAENWPRKGFKLINDSRIDIPLVWGFIHSPDNKSINLIYDIHPGKCFPHLYNIFNPYGKPNPLQIYQKKNNSKTYAGCGRKFVNIQGYDHLILEKIPEYCSIFGIPDDCFDNEFEKRMLDFLITQKDLELWCFEKTKYIEEKIEPNIKLKYMKGEILPRRYFFFVDTSSNFLRGIYSHRDIDPLLDYLWFLKGKEFIEKLDISNSDSLKYEEDALDFVELQISYELIKQLILLYNEDKFKGFKSDMPFELDLEKKKKIENDIEKIKEEIILNTNEYLLSINDLLSRKLTSNFKNSNFLVLDIEYLPVYYPEEDRTFNFPCIFSNILWLGSEKLLQNDVGIFIIPCHYCNKSCKNFRRHSLSYKCLKRSMNFVDEQLSYLEKLISTYEGLKIYSYGRSDIFHLDYIRNFFSDSFDFTLYKRKNRVRERRIIDISEDISISEKSLDYIENEILKKWLLGWKRRIPHSPINPKFMTKYGSNNWESNYQTTINICANDTISAFLYLIYQKFLKADNSISYRQQKKLNEYF